MSLGRKNNQSNLELFILKPKVKDEDGKPCSPYFSVLAKNQENDKWEETQKVNDVSGLLYRIDRKVGNFEGQEILSCQIYLKDEDKQESYMLDLKYSMLVRSIFNSLLSIKDFSKEVEIGLYLNKKKYPSASVKCGGESLGWAYSISDQPEIPKVKFKGKEMSDFTEVDNFFDNKMIELSAQLKGESQHSNSEKEEDLDKPKVEKAKVSKPKTKTAPSIDPDLDNFDESDEDSVPF